MSLEPFEAQEVARYLGARPGFDFNLSPEEIEEFSAIDDSESLRARVDRVEDVLRRQLLRRYRAYRERGLAGIDDYARGPSTRSSPAENLRESLAASQPLRRLFPDFYAAWLDYPALQQEDSEDAFFWIQARVEKRPAVALLQRLVQEDIVGQRIFYVSHFLDVGQSVAALVPVEEGTLFAYVRRVWLDRLSGLGAAIKKAVARRLLGAHMEEMIDGLAVCPSGASARDYAPAGSG
jgi:hypothetical protein